MKRILMGLLICSTALSLSAASKVTKIIQPSSTSETFEITEPGNYLLCNSFTYTGTDAAIHIKSSNVELCLFARNIILTEDEAIGILINKGADPEDRICEITINNDSITSTAETTGIKIENACKVRLHNMFTVGHFKGLNIDNSSDVCVERCEFANSEDSGVSVSGSEAVTFDNCVFKENALGLSISSSQDCKVLNCSFPNSTSNNLSVADIEGLLVKNSSFSSADESGDNLVSIFGQPNNNVRFECCTFISKDVDGFNAINSALNCDFVTNLIIDSCLFDVSNRNTGDRSTITLGSNTSNVHTVGCTLQGGLEEANVDETRTGIKSEGNNVLIQDTVLRKFNTGIELDGCGSTVRNCNIHTTEIGVHTLTNSSAHLIKDSHISTCSTDGIKLESKVTDEVVSGILHSVISNVITDYTSQGINIAVSPVPNAPVDTKHTIFDNDLIGKASTDGIRINDALKNRVDQNRVHNHVGGAGINDVPSGFPLFLVSSNQVFHNTAFNNGGANYIITSPPDSGPVVAVGAPTSEGDNISA